MAAPCLAPGTEHWFVGVGRPKSDRTELVLTNPDDAQAEVDLRFYGQDGRVVVPGSPGCGRRGALVAYGRVDQPGQGQGPLSLAVQASEGRVTAVAKRIRTAT